MKLTSRALKVGDTIIRKTPLETDPSYTTVPVTIKQKRAHHTEVEIPAGSIFILSHHKWNDDQWVRWK